MRFKFVQSHKGLLWVSLDSLWLQECQGIPYGYRGVTRPPGRPPAVPPGPWTSIMPAPDGYNIGHEYTWSLDFEDADRGCSIFLPTFNLEDY